MTGPSSQKTSDPLAVTYEEAFSQFLTTRIDPAWLVSNRKQAWEVFQSIGWPNPRDENWLRSEFRGFRLDKYLPNLISNTSPETAAPVRLQAGVETSGNIRLTNGVATQEALDPALAAKGVIVGSLARCAREHSDLVQAHLHRMIDPRSDRFAALQNAMWTDGGFVYVPRNVRIEKPIHIHAGLGDGKIDLSHLLIVLEQGAEATVLFESSSDAEGSGGFHCGGIELIQRSGSHLRFVNLQDWGRGAWHFAHQRASVGRDASLQWTAAAMGSRFAQVDQRVELVEPGANSQVNGVMFTRDRQHLVFNTLQHHKAPHCTSDFLYKSVLQDRSRTVWRGMIKVDEGAQKTDGYQRNDNLILSQAVRADSIPGLEINADDVRCTHGSTSGHVDEELIFYAQSRGFTRSEAIRMIVTGFFQQIFDRISIESVREALGAAIARQVRQYE